MSHFVDERNGHSHIKNMMLNFDFRPFTRLLDRVLVLRNVIGLAMNQVEKVCDNAKAKYTHSCTCIAVIGNLINCVLITTTCMIPDPVKGLALPDYHTVYW